MNKHEALKLINTYLKSQNRGLIVPETLKFIMNKKDYSFEDCDKVAELAIEKKNKLVVRDASGNVTSWYK